MKTLEPPRPARVYHIRCDYEACNALMECSKDDLTHEGDWRDGYSWAMTCPHCKRQTWVRDLTKHQKEVYK